MAAKTLNSAQREAVEYNEGPLLIVAGAGTGKTTVITQKIASLIDTGTAKPEEILALTFTDKAAGEMEERVDDLISSGYLDLSISTFHTFCQRLLESRGMDIGIPNAFRLFSETDAWLLMRKYIYELGLDYYRPLGNPGKHIHNFLQHFSKCKDELVSPADYVTYAEGVALDKDAVQSGEKERLGEIANAYHAYNQLLLDAGALDFGDLIFYAVKLLRERPAIRTQIQKRYAYILVDEFQDVNYAQYELVKLLVGNTGRLTVVGDDDQSIYAFRGASVSNILRFKDDFPDAKEIVLTENYRSRKEILDMAYASIQQNNPDRLEVKLHINKRLTSPESEKEAGIIRHLHVPTGESEVEVVVQEIISLKQRDSALLWDDIAILVRANNHADPFLQGLEQAGIPYEFLASRGLYRQPVVLDCVAFFQAIRDHYEALPIFRLLKLPFLGLAENDLRLLTHGARKKSVSYYEMLKRAGSFGLSTDGVRVCERMLSFVHKGMKKARYEKPTVVLYHFLEESGYLKYLADQEEAGDAKCIRQIYHLKQFFDFLASYEQAVPDAHVPAFVDHFEQILASGDEGTLFQPMETPDSVNVMTVHGSKGLEFRHVFIVNMVDDRFPSRRRGEAIELPEALVKEQLPEGDYHYQEERRLFYVAMTRAKERLYLTSADTYGGIRKKKVSRFLQEIHLEAEAASSSFAVSGIGLEKKQRQIEEEKTHIVYELPKKFSFSQIRAFQTCAYQYKLAYILKIPMKGSPYFSFGQTMHTTLQRFYERIQEINGLAQSSLFGLPESPSVVSNIKVPPLAELLKIYETVWISDWYNSKRQREEYYKKGKESLRAFYAKEDGQWTIPVAIESGFQVAIGGHLIHGRIDRVDRLPDGTLEIIDYKTGASKEKLSADDKQQLLLYYIAAEQLPEYRTVGAAKRLTFYYLNDVMRTSFEPKEKDVEVFSQKIIKTLDELHKTDFSSIGKKDMCGRCDFCKMGLV